MESKMVKNKYFSGTEFDNETIIVKTKLPFICDNNIPYLLDLLEKIDYSDKQRVLIELSEIETIDKTSLKLIIAKSNKILSKQVQLQLIVSDDKPSINYSIGDPISNLNFEIIHKSFLHAA